MKEFNNFFKEILKGVLIYIVLSIIEIILFSLILQVVSLNDGIIKIINQVFKIIFMVITCFITIKGEKGIIKGVLLGLFSAIILYFIFITFRINTFSLLSLVFEVIYLSIVGGICGIIAVNKKGV